MTAVVGGIVLMALLFVVFGGLALADGRKGCHGDCGACTSGDCDFEVNRSEP